MDSALNDVLGGAAIMQIAAIILLIGTGITAALHASGSVHHPVSRETRTFFWVSLFCVALRIVIRSHFDLPRYEWWGNVCWLSLAVSSVAYGYEHIKALNTR